MNAMLTALRRPKLELLYEFVKRLVAREYKGSRLGVLWTVLNPLLMAVVYTIVFAVFLRMRSPGGGGGLGYGLMVFGGLIPFRALAMVLNQAPSCIRSSGDLVKRVVFPVEILPVATAISAVANALFGLAVLLALGLLINGRVPATVLTLPAVYGVLLLFSVALAYWLSAAGTLVRDVGALMSPLTRALLFLSPVVWDIEVLSPRLQRLQMLNPVTVIVVSHRNAALSGRQPLWLPLLALALASLLLLAAGRWWFARQRVFFPEVL